LKLQVMMWMAMHDESSLVKDNAADFWQSYSGHILHQEIFDELCIYLNHQEGHVRQLAARSIAGLLGKNIGGVLFEPLFSKLIGLYVQSLPVDQKNSDKASRTRPLKPAVDSTVTFRCGISLSLLSIAELRVTDNEQMYESGTLLRLVDFLVNNGVVDSDQEVRSKMVSAAVAIVATYGTATIADILLSTLEKVLSRKPEQGGSNVTEFDHRYGATVVLLGTVGRHLGHTHPSLLKILDLLVESLSIPSESVQRAVSDCLIPIIQGLKGTEVVEKLMNQMISKTLQASTYGERRGSAFGLSALVKAQGIPSLKQYNLIARLKEACSGGSVSNRQGALFAIECLAERLGLLFEPYVIGIMDVLLDNFSHSSDHVREAVQGAVRIIMTKLSAHGAKQILAPVISALNSDSAWKTRQEAIKMLGAMANCAPKQLSACLPQIVPCLVQASSDSHPKVKESAKAAMSEISSVVRNPEINQLSPVLLGALGDPANRTKEALDTLLQCEFMHTIDAPSLALLSPILARALKDRSGDIKRKAAAITGNMMTMVSEVSVLSPYMASLLPGLKDCLIDPIPDVRASGAKALGSLYQGIGSADQELRGLLQWLIGTLRSLTSPVERSGKIDLAYYSLIEFIR
jgi:hypothetical protein